MDLKSKIILISGPTASGKSKFAIRLAKKIVYKQAGLAKKANLDAIVCSAHEIQIIRKIFKKEIIVPGVRFNSDKNDQKRVMTPSGAIKAGANSLVIGRPITKGNIKKNIVKLIKHLK